MKINNKGQTLIEFVVIFPVIIIFITGLMLALYLFFVTHLIKFVAEETLYCSLHTSSQICQAQKRKILFLLPGLEIKSFKVQESGTNRSVTLHWQLRNSFFPRVGQNIFIRTGTDAFNHKMQ